MTEAVLTGGTQAAVTERGPQVQQLLADILGLMGYPARSDLKDSADGGYSVALHFEGALPPGTEQGKRSHVMDSLQFLLNKMVNRPGLTRRWVTLGVGVHPEPRAKKEPGEGAAPALAAPRAAAPLPVMAPAARPAPAARAAVATPVRPAPDADERTLAVEVDEALQEAVRQVAEKAGQRGRFYAIAATKKEDRARMLQAVVGIPGVTVAAEGEGRYRRVVFTPEKPAPLPRRLALPEDDEDEA